MDLWRTVLSHGIASLPPMRVNEDTRTLHVTIPLTKARPRIVRVVGKGKDTASITLRGPALSPGATTELIDKIHHILRLDEDLSGFYAIISADPALAWASRGAGRMVRSLTVFEDVVKTICTTNCSWSATERMVGALVEHLGEPGVGAPPTGPFGRAFPTPTAMARADEGFYRQVARTGYRGAYLMSLSREVAEGRLELEALATAAPEDLPDEEVVARLVALPGVGPYAAAHIMMMLGRYRPLILDSWTMPKYARLSGKKSVTPDGIRRRFRRYGAYAGLAFWVLLTRDWIEEDSRPAEGIPDPQA